MKKNSKLRIVIETEVFERIKKDAISRGLSISEFCRNKLEEPLPLQRIELMLEKLCKKSHIEINSGRSYGI